MKKVSYFDVEYSNSRNRSICQMGLLCEDYATGEPFYPEREIYVNPEDGFDDICIKIHGITSEQVKNKPAFPAVWRDIERFFTNSVVVGHNVAAADLDALSKALKRYNIEAPDFYYVCTLELAQRYIPSFAVQNYSLSTLCDYFDIDIDSAHNAFDDACATSELFKVLVKHYDIDIGEHIKKYEPRKTKEFTKFIASPMIRKSISEFYGIIRGFSIDNVINDEEISYISQWRQSNNQCMHFQEIASICRVIDRILEDGVITTNEIIELQRAIKTYLDTVTSSPITLSTQILNGIMKGIAVDGRVSEDECRNFRQWLYDNIYLAGHYPFDRIMELLEDVLSDSIITKEEAERIMATIDELLNPVETLKSQVYTINGKRICLSGNFSYGKKPEVEKWIVARKGAIDSSVKKSTDILVVGDCECQAYSNGAYGTKVKKAIEYNAKGSNIQVIKESDLFAIIC